MIYWLAQQLVPHISGFNLFTYVSSRTLFAILTAFFIGFYFAPVLIRHLRRRGHGQPVRDDGPESHRRKSDTPTMGGLLVLFSVSASCLLWGDLTNPYLWLVMLTMAAFALIGWADDYLKISRRDSKGISSKVKFALQSLVAVIVLLVIWQGDLVRQEWAITIPYMKEVMVNAGIIGFAVLAYLTIVGASNAVNLTDGLDGLAILPAVIVAGGLGVYAYMTGHFVFSQYLGLRHISGVHELTIFCAAFIGAGLAFLWYNAHPAQVFMGDVGSLAIGAALGLIAVLVRQEIVFAIMSGVFVLEALSVIIQVGSYKMTRRRVFNMAPLHHHYELKGWNESQVVVRFWIIAIVLVIIGLAGLKIR